MKERQECITTLTLEPEDIHSFDEVQLILDGVEQYANEGKIIVASNEVAWSFREVLEDLVKSCKIILAIL